MMNNELKPCPFCGNEVSIRAVGVNLDNYVIRCPTYPCFTNTGWGHSDKDQLAEMWNKRANSQLTINGQLMAIDVAKIKQTLNWGCSGVITEQS